MKLFKSFDAGTIFNPILAKPQHIRIKYKEIKIKFPSRLNAMALDSSKIAFNENMVFKPGEIVFSVKIYHTFTVRRLPEKNIIEISPRTKRKALVKHAALLMKKALSTKDGLYIDVDNHKELIHCGLGSSSALIAGVACVINEMYGCPVLDQILVKYLAQNHGEEIEDSGDIIQQVQCIGGSVASGMFKGGLLVISGESEVIKTMNIQNSYSALIAIPKDFKELNASFLMKAEEKNLPKFIETGKRFGSQIAYRMLHEVLPAMNTGNLKPVGDLIYDYRFKMGSIENCSFVYPKMVALANKLKRLKIKGIVEVLALSSVGPAFFLLTKEPELCRTFLESLDLRVLHTEIENNKYRVLKKIKI